MLGLGDVLTNLRSLSSSFLLSYVLPALLFELGSVALYTYVIEGMPVAFPHPATTDQFLWPVIDLAFGAVVIAALLSASTGLVRQFLEGQYLVAPLARYLVQRNDRVLQGMLDDETMALDLVTATKAVRDASKTSVQKERNARPSGAKVTDNGLIQAAGAAERGLKAIALFDASARLDVAWIQARRADLDQWTKVSDAIVAALHANCADPEAVPVADMEAARALDTTYMRWIRRLDGMVDDAQRYANIYRSRRVSAFARADVRPTRFGNLRAIMEAHTLNVYGTDFSYMWPRIQAQLDLTAGTSAALNTATTRLELALSLVFLAAAAAVFWPIALLVTKVYVACAIAIALAPLLLWASYQLALESQRTLTTTIWAIIDRDRLKVLEAMHIVSPTSTVQERQQWEHLLLNLSNAKIAIPLEPKAATP